MKYLYVYKLLIFTQKHVIETSSCNSFVQNYLLIYLARFVASKQPRPETVDYKIWGVMQQRVYQTKVQNVNDLKRRLINGWADI